MQRPGPLFIQEMLKLSLNHWLFSVTVFRHGLFYLFGNNPGDFLGQSLDDLLVCVS